MPIYDYKCNTCDSTYEVFHKVREVLEDVVCPSCGSTQHTRLISAPSVQTRPGKSGTGYSADQPCADGSCCGGACNLN